MHYAGEANRLSNFVVNVEKFTNFFRVYEMVFQNHRHYSLHLSVCPQSFRRGVEATEDRIRVRVSCLYGSKQVVSNKGGDSL